MDRICRLLFIPLIFFTITTYSPAQDKTEKWVLTKNNEIPIYVDVGNVKNFKGDDIYVWTMMNHNPPLVIESIEGKIYKSKTYYLINKKLNKYSLLEIVYYDYKGDVLKSFSYNHDTDVETYKYNYPIMPNSDVEAILKKCLSYAASDSDLETGKEN